MNDNSYKVIEVDINEILPNRFQPRIQFDEEEILELSDSIKEHGVIQPLVVRTIGDKYEIIAGERRYKASVLAGKESVPVIIKNLNDKDSAEIALIENIQRKNLTPIEEALSYKKILDMGYITQENLATKLGKSQSSVANKIRLLNLSDEVQEALLDNKISERHARSLLRLKSIQDQNEMLNKIIFERMTVRKTDEEIDKLLNISKEEAKEIKEEKGEERMNNQINQIPNVVTQSSNATFDIFAAPSTPAPVIPSVPVVEVPVAPVTPVVEMPQMSGIQFDDQGNVIAAPSTPAPVVPSVPVVEVPVAPVTPVVEMPQMSGIQFDDQGNVIAAPSAPVAPAPVMPEVPSVPVTPVVEVPQMGGIQFDAQGNVIAAPSAPVAPAPVIPEVPATPVVEVPQMSGIQFDAQGNVIAAPSAPVAPAPVIPEVPATPVVEVPQMSGIQFDAQGNVIAAPSAPVAPAPVIPEVPVTAPIIESTPVVENVPTPIEIPVMPTPITTVTEPTTINEAVTQGPIIITDYSKQYDPVMPVTTVQPASKVDFKEIINAIRECSAKIEQYGYKIDVEEYDLSTLYQVVFKIEK